MDTEIQQTKNFYGSALITCVVLATLLSLLAIYDASALKASEQFGDSLLFVRKHALATGLGFILMLICQRIPLAFFKRLTLPLLLLSIGLLALIFVPGLYVKVGGANRWLRLPGLQFQPAELAKLALVLFLARNLSRSSYEPTRFLSGTLPNLLVVGALAALLMLQPDLGSAVLLTGVTFVMIFVSGIPLKFVYWSGGGAFTAVTAAIIAEPYRLQRILAFLDPWKHRQEGGFQIIQSYLAFQNGGLLGLGLGESKQKLFFLPEAHTDFILSVIAEELGFAGVLLVIGIFVMITILGIKIANKVTTDYERFLAFGLTSLIAVEGLFNMGVVTGLLPTKGIPLPFFSSGSSSLLIFLLCAGILARLGREPLSAETPS